MDAWARLLTHRGLPLVPFLWRDLKVYGAWRLDLRRPTLFLVRRADPLLDVLLVRAAVAGPLCALVESGRGLWLLPGLAPFARRVPFGAAGDAQARGARQEALEACLHQMLEGGWAALVAGDGRWHGERVEPLEALAARFLDRCADIPFAPQVVPLRLSYGPTRLGPGAARMTVGDPLPKEAAGGAGLAAALGPALDAGAGSGAPPEELDALAGLAGWRGGVEEEAGGPLRLPADFEARVGRARLDRPLEVRALLEAAQAYREALAGLEATDAQVRRAGELGLTLRATALVALAAAGLLPALFGALANAPPLLLSALFARSAPGPGAPSPAQSRLLASALLFLPWYALAGAALVGTFGPWRGAALLLSLPVAGAWALLYGGRARSVVRAAWRLRRAPVAGGLGKDLEVLRAEVTAALGPLSDLYETSAF